MLRLSSLNPVREGPALGEGPPSTCRKALDPSQEAPTVCCEVAVLCVQTPHRRPLPG